MIRLPSALIRCFALCAALLLLTGCQIESQPKSDLEKIQQRGVLRVGTLNNQLSYYIGPEGPTGLDYELAQALAKELGVRIEIKPAYRLAELFPALQKGEIDLIATGLNQETADDEGFHPGPTYYYVSQQVIYKKGQRRPRDLKQLVKYQQQHVDNLATNNPELARESTLKVVANSSFVDTLKQQQQNEPELAFRAVTNADNQDLLQQVSSGDLPFTVADSIELSLAQRLYPDLATAFELTEDQPVSWYLRRSEDESLYALLIEFFGQLQQSGQLSNLEEKYLGHIGSFDYVDTRAFIRALDKTLPKWEPIFKQYSEEFDWRLIAAISYQESHWRPKAKSPTGVRGMMMLTLPTARSVGVTDRLDPEQSIRGGVAYFRRIIARIPDSIEAHEKYWFALASYNIGYGHMMDARRLTERQGGNPNEWGDVKERLPQLRKKQYYTQTRYGYARGDEALNYVENIRRYYQSIVGHVEQHPSLENNDNFDDLAVIPDLLDENEDEDELDEAIRAEQENEQTVGADSEQNTSSDNSQNQTDVSDGDGVNNDRPTPSEDTSSQT